MYELSLGGMLDSWFVGVACVCGFLFVYIYSVWPQYKLRHTRLKGPTHLPFIGTMARFFTGKLWYEVHLENKKKYGDIIQCCEARVPTLVVFDRDIIQEITVKQGTKFVNRQNAFLGGVLEDSLVCLRDDAWKRARACMTHAFTASKVRQMESLLVQHKNRLIDHLMKAADAHTDVELKRSLTVYTTDVTCSTIFGMDVNSFDDADNLMLKHVEELFHKPKKIRGLLLLLAVCLPFLTPILEWFNISFVSLENVQYFKNIARKVVEERKQHPSPIKNFIQTMVDGQTGSMYANPTNSSPPNGSKPTAGLSDEEIVGESFLLMLASVDTTALTAGLALYHLALHPQYQAKARDEVDELYERQSKPSIESIVGLRYLDMCFYETMRLYPTSTTLERSCSQDTVIKGIPIPANTLFVVPVHAIHRDPQLWDQPDQFIPDRHSTPVSQYQFMPFGVGPRSCIGKRLGELTVKLVIVEILRHFEILQCEKTKPVELQPTFSVKTKNGLWVRLKRRTDPV